MGDIVGELRDFADSPIGQIALGVLNFYVPGAGFAISAGLSLADSALNAPDPGADAGGAFSTAARARTFSSRQAIEYRKFIYGNIRVGAGFTLIHQTDSNRQHHYLFTATGHPVDAITAVYANGEHIPLDGDGQPSAGNKYRGHLRFYFGTGTIEGDADLQAALIANTGGLWKSTDMQRHCAKIYVHLTSWSNSVFPSGLPNFSFDIRGKKLFDPRVAGVAISTSGAGAAPLITTSSAHGCVAGDMVFIQNHTGSTPAISGMYEVLSAPTTTTLTLQMYRGDTVTVTGSGGTLHKCAWSQNAALMVCDYLITPSHRGGFGADYATEIDETLMIAAANACENLVSVPGEKVDIASVDTGADTVDTVTSLSAWATGDRVQLQTTGTLPDPLVVATTYYLIRVDGDTYQLAASEADALAGTEIVLTDGGTGTHTMERLFSAFTHDVATDELTLSQEERAWLLGDVAEVETAGTLPPPLAGSTSYYIIPVAGAANRIRLATSRANAIDGTAIDLTGTGSGTFYIRRKQELRYTANGQLSTAPAIRQNFQELVSAMVGDLVYVGGKYKVYAGVWRAPSLSIGAENFRGSIRMETDQPREKHVNTVRGLYSGPASVDQLDDYPAVIDATALSEDDGETFAGNQDFPYTNSPTMATRCARILLRRNNKSKTLAIPGTLALWRHEPADVINVDYARFGLSSAPYQVSDATLSIADQNGAPLVTYDMVLRETASTIYDHDPDDEFPPPPASSPVFPNFKPPAPTALGFAPTNFDISTGGGVLSWTASDDGFVQSGGYYNVDVSADAGATYTPVAVTTGTQADLEGLVPGSYTARVVAVAATSVGGAQSDPATFALTIASPSILPQVSGLELRGNGGNLTEFEGRNAKFVWRAASVQGSYDLDAEPAGGDDGYIDPYFKDYEVRILKTDGTLLRVEHTTDIFWDYTFEKNAEDYFDQEGAAGAYREFVVEVYQRGNQNQISPSPAKMTVSNPAPAALAGVALAVKFNEIGLSFTTPTDLDFEGVIIWISETGSFTPGDGNKFGEFAKTQNPIFFEADPQTTYYIRAAAFDAFGKTGLNLTSELSTTTGTAGTEYFSSISADIITSGEIAATETITVGGSTVTIDGVNNNIVVTDEQGSPVTRAKIGKLGAGAADYGIELFDSSGNLIFDADGLGLDVVGAANIADLSVDTIAIADSATMIVSDAFTAGNVSVSNTSVWTTIQTVVHSSTGLNGLIFADIEFTNQSTSVDTVLDYRVQVDGVTKREVIGGIYLPFGGTSAVVTAVLSDIFSYAFSSGTETVRIQTKQQNFVSTCNARNRTLTVWEPKK